MREFGEQNDIEILTGEFEPCDEGDAWTVASLAAHVRTARYVYRLPRPTTHVFLLLFSIQNVG